MSKIMENVALVNSAVRTLLGLVMLGGLGFAGWYAYTTYNAHDLAIAQVEHELADARVELNRREEILRAKDRTIESLNSKIQEQHVEIARLDTAMRLLKVEHRVARLTVLDQAVEVDSGKILTRLAFQELDSKGGGIDEPRQFQIPGDVVYIDSWVVKFDDRYVEEADLNRATSLVLFRRLFGEHQRPLDGFALDKAGARPKVYGRNGEMSEFEKKIWADFWTVANDEAKQDKLGIRAAHGEAPSIKVQKGKSYRIELRASSGLTIVPEEGTPPRPVKPST